MTATKGSNGHNEPFALTGQTAIVTGAATCIGEAIARRPAQAGAIIAIVDIDGPGSEQTAAEIGHGPSGPERRHRPIGYEPCRPGSSR